ncbi:MAG: hypothetical protein KYX68_08290 [Flavobacterium sp.]|nr:hypothetical protein [Flavobacterium sp.]
MKTLILFFIYCVTPLCYSQINLSNSSQAEELDLNELPEIVISKIGDDFSIYLPDKNPDLGVRNLQKYFVAYDLGKDYEGYDTYLVMMKNDKGTLTATYNQNGKLIRVVEKYKNVKLPDKVISSVLKAYPGWGIVDDKFHYAQADGDITKKQYHVKIKKDNKFKKLVLDPNGEIISGL